MRRGRLVPLVRVIAVAGFAVGGAAFLWSGFGSQSSTPVSAATHFIEVGDFWFCDSSFQAGDCELVIAAGDTVTWGFDSALFTHTSTECTGSCGLPFLNPASRLWHSPNMTSGTFERTFDTPGTFQYQCNIHPGLMRGTIIVNGAVPTLPMPPSPAPSETATPVPTSTAALAPTATPSGLLGDVNDDGRIDPIDAALVLQFSAGILPVLPTFDRGDVNQDGTVNAIDAALILQFAAGLLTTL